MNALKRLIVFLLILTSTFPFSPSTANAKSGDTDALQNGVRLLRADESGVILELNTPSYVLKESSVGENFQLLTVPGYENTSTPGEPQVPTKSVLLGVPPVANVKLRVIAAESETFSEKISLRPAPSPRRLTDDLQPGEVVAQLDGSNYELPGLLPDVPAEIASEAWLRDQRIVRVELHPFQYDHARLSLLWHRRLRVEVIFEQPKSIAEESNGLVIEPSEDSPGHFSDVLRSALLNYEVVGDWRGLPRSRSKSSLPFTSFEISASGPRHKIVIDQDGIYKLTYDDLTSVGMDVSSIDPRYFHMTSQGEEVDIFVFGQSDGSFDPGDHITFYGQRFYGGLLAQKYASENASWMSYSPQLSDGTFGLWKPEFNATMMEKYTDENVYWLTVEGTPGSRMSEVSGQPGGTATVPQYYTETVRAEQSQWWYTTHFTSEDTWFWDRIQDTVTHTFATTLSSLATDPISATLRAEVVAGPTVAYSFNHQTRFFLNGNADPIDDAIWQGRSRYRLETQIPLSLLQEGENRLKLSSQISDDLFFDWFEIQYARLFKAVEDQLVFSMDEGGMTWQYEIGDFTSSNIEVYEITDPLKPIRIINPSLTGGIGKFEAAHEDRAEYFVAGSDAIREPADISYYVPPNLKSPANSADYILITHPDFITAAQTLADYRTSQGLSTMVVDVEDLYNEFSEGIFHPIAIKSFLKYAFDFWQAPPIYVLLIGDGHWNLKNYQTDTGKYSSLTDVYMPPNLVWVDPWQGEVDSANLLATVVGDDPLPDLHIGRMPVNTPQELSAIVDKIIKYEGATIEDWQYRSLFVADNPDAAGDFELLAEGIIGDFISAPFQSHTVFTNEYIEFGDCNPFSPCPAINQEIIQTMNETGASLINFIGHGSINRWAHESILTNDDIGKLTNGDKLPVVLSMDCLDGYWMYPGTTGLMEEMLRAPNKGMVSSFSPTGLGVATGHDALQRGFYEAVFEANIKELGPASLAGKVALYTNGGYYDLLHTFTVFGDPALKMKVPAPSVYLPVIVRSEP